MTSGRRHRWRCGEVIRIPLAGGRFGYGQMLERPDCAFFDLATDGTAEPENAARRPVLFRLWVMRHAFSTGRWTMIGGAPLQDQLRAPVLRFNQDPLDPRRIHLGFHGDKAQPATVDQCEGLERAAVWEPEHVEDRLEDHFAGRPNKWVESLRPRRGTDDAPVVLTSRSGDPNAGRSPRTSFSAMVEDAFGFLVTDLGFRLERLDERQREWTATFRSAQSSVSVFAEPFARTPSVSVAGHALLFAVRDACPEKTTLLESGASLREAMLAQAALLREAAGDLLAGDESRAPRLLRLAAEERRRRNKELYGTSTGETPRFPDRPTLEELFRVPPELPPVGPRVVQAIWDYEYQRADVARHLGITETEVQAMLDGWDGA